MNLPTILIGLVLLALLGLALRHVLRHGSCDCGGSGCSGCAGCNACHPAKKR